MATAIFVGADVSLSVILGVKRHILGAEDPDLWLTLCRVEPCAAQSNLSVFAVTDCAPSIRAGLMENHMGQAVQIMENGLGKSPAERWSTNMKI